MSALPRFSSMSYLVTVKATALPSGETTGAPTRWTAHIVSMVKGDFSWPATGATATSRNSATDRDRIESVE
jgi:hypothetical protein